VEDVIFIGVTIIIVKIMAMMRFFQVSASQSDKNIGDKIMRKIFLTVSLSVALAATSYAGDTPIAGVTGCAPGLWYPESQVCVYGLSAPVEIPKPEQSTNLETILLRTFLHIRDMIF
jgi:hypothetical protein